MLAQIRAVIAESPFHGEGHRKIWARLRALKGVRTSMRRVLRVMRDAELLAPARQPAPVVDRPHDGTIVTERPNVMWGTDATAAGTILGGNRHDLRSDRSLHRGVRGHSCRAPR